MGNLDFIDWSKVRVREPYEELITEFGIPYPIFPCGKNKRPLTEHGFKDASTDEERVKAMFRACPGARIGMPTGRASGIFVIDIDTKDGPHAQDWMVGLNLHNGTKCVKTQSGGYHLWYRMPDVELRNTQSKLHPNVDTRGEGGYVLIPPSDGYYEFNDLEPAELPEFLLEELTRKPAPATSVQHVDAQRRLDGGTAYGLEALARECAAIRSAADGQKHGILNKAAYSIGGLVGADELDEGIAIAELRGALFDIRDRCRDFRAAERTLENSFADGLRRPRQVDHLDPVDDGTDWTPILSTIRPERTNLPERQVGSLIPDRIMQVDGFLREFVDYTTRTARRPQPFAALAAGIALVGALAGRRYRTQTDLWSNIYVATIIDSAGGKDHARKVIKLLLQKAGLMSYLGGEDIASGTALHTSLMLHPSRVYLVDECGDFLRGVLGTKASAHKQQIAQKLKALYTSSSGIMLGTEYADQSEKGRKREDLCNPVACIYGTSTPAQFWDAVAGASLSDGLMGRFLVFVPEENYPAMVDAPLEDIPDSLVDAVKRIAAGSTAHAPGNIENLLMATEAAAPYTVQSSLQAVKSLKEIQTKQETLLRQNEGTYITSLAGRIVENALKLALISAISREQERPVISGKDMEWAGELALHCFDAMRTGAERYASENQGQARMKDVLNAIRRSGEVTARQVMRALGMKISVKERDEALSALVEGGWIVAEQKASGAKGGRPSVVYKIAE
ncbi:bifunctional DNA primase/polymerase [Acetobacter sp. P5B1]|uniref:bifunctional DNA primase/polymerase n=1 Tax=Acetobacter sp. P5B1 TaxID=2762620 RepID=UPI001C05089A